MTNIIPKTQTDHSRGLSTSACQMWNIWREQSLVNRFVCFHIPTPPSAASFHVLNLDEGILFEPPK